MLSQIIHILEESQGNLSVSQLGMELGSDSSAVAGMLETLIHMGRVVEVDADCGFCESCAIKSKCILPVKRTMRYQLSCCQENEYSASKALGNPD